MLIKFSLPNGRYVHIDCDPNATIKDITPRITSSFELNNIKNLKIIYKGRKLEETQIIKDLQYAQGDLIIVHFERNNEPPPPQSNSTASNENKEPSQPAKPPPALPQSSTPPETSRPPPESSIPSNPPPSENIPTSTPLPPSQKMPPVPLPEPEKWESNIEMLTSMGFDEYLSVQALVQAYNNLERAVDLITSGSVQNPEQPNSPSSEQNSPSPSPNSPQFSYSEPSPSLTPTSQETPQDQSEDETPTGSNGIQDHQNQYFYQYDFAPEQVNDPRVSNDSSSPRPLIASDLPDQGRFILPNPPPADPDIEPDEDFELIRYSIIRNPSISQDFFVFLSTTEGIDLETIQSIIDHPSIFFNLMGIPHEEPFPIPDTFTDEDINAIWRLNESREYTWEQVIDAYETSERNEELAQFILMSLND